MLFFIHKAKVVEAINKYINAKNIVLEGKPYVVQHIFVPKFKQIRKDAFDALRTYVIKYGKSAAALIQKSNLTEITKHRLITGDMKRF